jgi:hypothetical protein
MKRMVVGALLCGLMMMTAQAQDTEIEVEVTPALTFDWGVCTYVEGEPTTQECLDLMAADPEPELETVPQDGYTLGVYSFWRVGPDAVNKHDAPGGNVIGQIAAGFNFVNAIDTSNPEWLQIQGGEWIPKALARYVEPSYFTGVLLPEVWERPFAWVLDTTGIYSSLTPGGASSAESGYLTQRYDLVYIFAEAYDSEGWRWYMVGPNQWIKQTFVAKIQPAPIPEDAEGRWVAVDLYEQTLVAYEDDKPVFATLISTGLETTETNLGYFNVWARLPTDRMSGAAGAPNAYDLQTVPWVMYFDGSISLHGTYWHDFFGYRRSRGCVNLSISDARWVFNWMEQAELNPNGELVNPVYVFTSGEYGEPPARPSG